MAESLCDLLECSICDEVKDELRILTCHHSYCSECLVAMMTPMGVITCPACRCETMPPGGWVDQLPVDFNHQKFKDVLGSAASVGVGRLCGFCASNKSVKRPVAHCTQCDEDFCSSCHALHSQNPITKNHTVQFIDLLQAGDTARERRCEVHSKECQAVCMDCQRGVCIFCMMGDTHTRHSIMSVEEAGAEVEERIAEVVESMKSWEIKAIQKLDQIQGGIERQKGALVEAETEIEVHAEMAVAEVEENKQNLLQNVRSAINQNMAELEKRKSAVERSQAAVKGLMAEANGGFMDTDCFMKQQRLFQLITRMADLTASEEELSASKAMCLPTYLPNIVCEIGEIVQSQEITDGSTEENLDVPCMPATGSGQSMETSCSTSKQEHGDGGLTRSAEPQGSAAPEDGNKRCCESATNTAVVPPNEMPADDMQPRCGRRPWPMRDGAGFPKDFGHLRGRFSCWERKLLQQYHDHKRHQGGVDSESAPTLPPDPHACGENPRPRSPPTLPPPRHHNRRRHHRGGHRRDRRHCAGGVDTESCLAS